ncbi:rootletin-like [Hylobates moloch]|uniref:rootletin-like n=1 Tax=Hylobates moloch TaxID=81572 RepID=UPI0026749111|nr:rootletin-like [Hylobates moloch]
MGLQLAESWAEAALEKQALLQAQLEKQLRDKVLREKDLAQQQMQRDLDKADLSARWVPGGCRTRQASVQKVKLESWGEGSICSLEAGPSSVSSASFPRHPTEVPKALALCKS